MNTKKEIYDNLHKIYQKHRKKHKSNPDSKQMCCMWSTQNPPDVIEDTDQIYDIEEVFNISIDDNDCYLIYDMYLDEATLKITEIIKQQC